MKNEEKYFIRETQEHVENVKRFIDSIIICLKTRAVIHDYTKFDDPEKKIFIEMTPKLKGSTYNSPEYKGFLEEMKVALDHHYKTHRHHPEFFKNGIDGMNLIDLVELFCDWKAASLRHKNGDINTSIDQNIERFNLSPQLVSILKNSIELFESNDDKLAGTNIKEPVIQINHKDLERFGNSPYKSVCPKCEEGLLLIGRNQGTLILQRHDHCVLCGQQYEYLDIQKLRKAEGNEHGIDKKI